MQWISSFFRKCYNIISSISKKCWKFIASKMLEIKSRHLTWVGSIYGRLRRMHFYLLLHYLLGSPCQFNTESTMIAPCIGLDLFMKSVIRNERINSKLPRHPVSSASKSTKIMVWSLTKHLVFIKTVAISRTTATPDPLSLYPGLFGTVSQWAPMTIGLSFGWFQFLPGRMAIRFDPAPNTNG